MKQQQQQHQEVPISMIMGDIEIDTHERQREQESLEIALNSIGGVLDHASDILDGLERDGMLAPAIRRYAADLAEVVGNVARDLDCDVDVNAYNENGGDNDSKRRKWARALIEDAHSQLALEVEQGKSGPIEIGSENKNDNNNAASLVKQKNKKDAREKSAAGAITELSEGEVINALSAARLILLDIEEALIDISTNEDDAEEIADVGLVVAKMFLWGLQNVQKQVVKTVVSSSPSSSQVDVGAAENSLAIEIIHDDDDIGAHEGPQENTSSTSKIKNDSNDNENTHRHPQRKLDERRMRILWPPIGPAVLSVASWGKNEAVKNPILSIAVAMALWPMALIVAFIGAPILAVDYALQSSYDALSADNGSGSGSGPHPFIRNVEIGAANVCHVGKFYYLISKMMLKQGLRVGKRQIKRRGGVGKVAGDVGNWAVDRALHPVDSLGMAWNTIRSGADVLVEAASFVKDVATGKVEISNNSHLHL